MTQKRAYWLWLAAILLIGGGWIWLTRAPQSVRSGPPPAPKEGFSAPDFTLQTLDGKSVSLSELRGKVVLVNFWATTCHPCEAEMPTMERVYEQEKGKGFVVLAVTAEPSAEAVRAFVQKYGITFTVLLDRNAKVSREYRVYGTPTSFFVDRRGVIRWVVFGGPMSEALIRSKVETLLKEKP